MDIHQAYRIAYEAALSAQLVSLQARLAAARTFTQNHAMFVEASLLKEQIKALEAEVKKLNQ